MLLKSVGTCLFGQKYSVSAVEGEFWGLIPVVVLFAGGLGLAGTMQYVSANRNHTTKQPQGGKLKGVT